MMKSAEAYQVVQDAPPQSPHTTVVVPTSEHSATAAEQHAPGSGPGSGPASGPVSATITASADGVDSTQFYRAIVPICERLDLQ